MHWMDFRRSTYALAVFLTTLLGATPAGAKMVKLDVDLKASEITATVDQPLARMQGSVSGTFKIITAEIEGDPVGAGG